MNIEVLILFLNATLVTVISSAVVIWILKKQYLPAIKKAEQEQEQEQEEEQIYKSN